MANTAFTQNITSTRPYLVRALYEWCTDNGFTPYVAVAVDASVQVPMEYVKNNEIVLNVGFEATSSLNLSNDFINFKARFGGVSRDILVPMERVIAIYARENGQGMAFPLGSPAEPTATSSPSLPSSSSISAASSHAAAAPASLTAVSSSPQGAAVNKVVKLTSHDDNHEPPKPPSGPRPSLKRIK